jgi:ATP-dependent helicase HepA
MQSTLPDVAEKQIEEMRIVDRDRDFDTFAKRLLGHFGIRAEPVGDRIVELDFTLLNDQSFPVPAQSLTTTSRKTALEREEFNFLTWDHPMITGAMDLLLSRQDGNSVIAFLPDLEPDSVLLEIVFILECVAPGKLFAERFMPSLPIRIVVNESMEERTDTCPPEVFRTLLKNRRTENQSYLDSRLASLIRDMLAAGRQAAESVRTGIIEKRLGRMTAFIDRETERLCALRPEHRTLVDDEIQLLKEERAGLEKVINDARLRLDAVRLICKDPE